MNEVIDQLISETSAFKSKLTSSSLQMLQLTNTLSRKNKASAAYSLSMPDVISQPCKKLSKPMTKHRDVRARNALKF